MKTILLDPLPASGHISSFLRMASYLKEKGYRCVFMGQSDQLQEVTSKGFEFELIHTFIVSTEKVQIKNEGWFSLLTESLLGKRNQKFKKEIGLSFSLYDKAIDRIKPDLIILDDQYSKKAFFYSRYGLPIICLQTKVNPHKYKDIPPFQSHQVPSGSPLSQLTIEIAWCSIFLKRTIQKTFWTLVTLGKTSTSFLKEEFKGSEFTIEENRCFVTGIKELPMVLASPRVFDFPRPKSDNIYHFFRASTPGTGIDDPRLKGIIERKDKDKTKIIYCSLGTVTTKYERVCTAFYRRIFKVARHMTDHYFIVSVGKNYEISKLGDRPQNVSIFQSVPQKELLRYVDLMIGHGGMNSIMECIHAVVPMIILPLSLDWDQPGNGARVAYHGLGTCSKLRSITPGKLIKNILKVSDNISLFKKNLIDFKELVARQSSDDMKDFELLIEKSILKSADQRTLRDLA